MSIPESQGENSSQKLAPSATHLRLARCGFTLPVESGLEAESADLVDRWSADAVRNSDGTELSDQLRSLGTAVVETLCLIRQDDAFARARPDLVQSRALRSNPVEAVSGGVLCIDPLEAWSREQLALDEGRMALARMEVHDRTLGRCLDDGEWAWRVGRVEIASARPGHQYTVNFIARQRWDATTYYNRMVNGWEIEPRPPLDPVYPEARAHLLAVLEDWLRDHPGTGVVRLTSLIYHFPISYGADEQARATDWFGYQDAASAAMLDAFESETGRRIALEEVLEPTGVYPGEIRRAWMDFVGAFVRGVVQEWVERIHAAGRQALFFFGDHWIGAEPYGEGFAEMGLDALVGTCVHGSALRMLADVPGAILREGRLHPYFFPDQFSRPEQPLATLNGNWRKIRRALLRQPLDRIGFGGFLHLVSGRSDFLEAVDRLRAEFELALAAHHEGPPEALRQTVAVVNAWGALRSWMNIPMWYEERPPGGFMEALSGLPMGVEFLSFADLDARPPGQWPRLLIVYGQADSAWGAASAWRNPRRAPALQTYLETGGTVLEVGTAVDGGIDPTGCLPFAGQPEPLALDTICEGEVTPNAGAVDWLGSATNPQSVSLGAGHLLRLADFRFSPQAARLLLRLLLHGLRVDPQSLWLAEDPRVDVAWFPQAGALLAARYDATVERTVLRRGERESVPLVFESGQNLIRLAPK